MNNFVVSEYWSTFWSNYNFDPSKTDEHTQVARTRDKKPISSAAWEFTLSHVREQLQLDSGYKMLDLCCGNGMFTRAFSHDLAEISAVDISGDLIHQLQKQGLSNVTAFAMDVRAATFEPASFDRVIWYAGIQYLSETDIIQMLRNLRSWMTVDGVMLIGDIPDRDKMWHYFNSDLRVRAFADALLDGRPIIGTWLDREWLTNIICDAGFSKVVHQDQPENLIYSDFRFDTIVNV